MTDNEILNSHIIACDKHVDMIQFCYDSIKKYFPFTDDKIESLNKLEIALVDDFLGRLARLQDTIVAKIFVHLLRKLGEDADKLSYIDRLNILEKLDYLSSAHEWQTMRKVRSYMIHEYPQNFETIILNLNKSEEMKDYMLKYWSVLKPKLTIILD